MFKRLLLFILIVLESGILFAGNPVMLVRCGRPRLAVDGVLASGCEELGDFISFDGHCYTLPVDGSCPTYPESMVLETKEVLIAGVATTICVPKCANECGGETCYEWNTSNRKCECELGSVESIAIDLSCNCPEFLDYQSSKSPTSVASFSTCVLPQKHCYDLGIEYTIDPFVCDGPDAATSIITIIIKGEGGANLTPDEDAITIGDLQNCLLTDDTEELIELKHLYADAEAAFVANDEGCIVLEFTRDPYQETIIELPMSDTSITIPACPRVFDPCSCANPDNVTDANGIVQFWYDEMTVVGAVGTPVILKANNIPNGFLTTSQGIVANGTTLGSIGSSRTLVVPFLRTPGILTDVEITQTVGGVQRSAFLMSGCALAVDACIATPVPTMGVWGILVLGLILVIMAIVSYSGRTVQTS